jgi:predicted Zn-dependent protease
MINKAISIEGDNPDYWFTLGRVLAENNQEGEARAAFKRATALDPANSEMWMYFAEFLHSRGKVDDAIGILKKGNLHNDNSAVLKYHLAAYLLERNCESVAVGQLETALKLDFNLHKGLFEVFPKAAQNDSVKRLIKAYNPHK